MQKLNQVIACEKGLKDRVEKGITALYHEGQKADPFNGFVRAYAPKNEDGDKLPPETKMVQTTADIVLASTVKLMTDLFDVRATLDFANCSATADVVVGDEIVVQGAPATYLLFLNQKLIDLRTIVDKLPTLSPDDEWTLDPATAMFRSKLTETIKTAKVQESLILTQATDKHPATAQMITVDRTVGTWSMQKLSGAMPAPKKAQLLARIETLHRAVRFALEQANMTEAPPKVIGAAVLGWIFSGKTA